MKHVLAALFLSLSCLSAAAQSCWPDPNGTRANCGSPVMYVNGSGQAVPVDATHGLPVTIVSGGGGAGDASAANQALQITQETAINTVLGTTATATWDGSAAAAMMAIQRYQGVKLEAIRALLAAPLAVTGTFFQATQPISAASLPLPSGASTAANQTSPQAPLAAAAPTATVSLLMGGRYTTATPSFTDGQQGAVSFTSDGRLRVGLSSAAPIAPAAAAATSSLLLGGQYNSTQSTFTDGQQGSLQISARGELKGVVMDAAGNARGANVSAANELQVGSGTLATAANQTVEQAPVLPGAATATKSGLVAGQYNSAVQAFTNGQQGSLQFDQRGGLLVQDGQAIPSVSVTSAATLFTVADTSGYGSVSVQVTSAGTSCTITYKTSEDGVTWTVAAGTPPGNTGTTAAMVTTSTAVGQFIFNTYGKMFRAEVTTYGSGTVTVQGTLRKDAVSRASVGIGNTVTVVGNTTEGAAVGATAIPTSYEARTTNKAADGNGTNVKPIATSIGAAVNKPFQVPELDWSYPAAAGGISNTTSAVTMVAAAGAGIRNYVTSCQLSSDALGAATEIAIRDGAAGTVIWRMKVGTAGIVNGIQLAFQSPIKSTANTLLEFVTLTASITGAVFPNCQGYQAP